MHASLFHSNPQRQLGVGHAEGQHSLPAGMRRGQARSMASQHMRAACMSCWESVRRHHHREHGYLPLDLDLRMRHRVAAGLAVGCAGDYSNTAFAGRVALRCGEGVAACILTTLVRVP